MPKGAKLLKTVVSMTRWPDQHRSLSVVFFPEREDGEQMSWHRLCLDRDVWEDMGEPDRITVAIEPGDKLNEEGA